MISTDQIERLLSGGTVVSKDGEKIGKVGQVFLDDRSGDPEWVTARTGLFGTAESFVPLAGADVEGDEIRVPFAKDQVKDAPRVSDSGGHLSPDEETELYRYYGRAASEADADASTDRPGEDAARGAGGASEDATDAEAGDREADRGSGTGVVGRHAAGPPGDAQGTVRLRRYVVTEYVTQTRPGGPDTPGDGAGTAPGDERTVTERVREEVLETDEPRPGTTA